MDKLSPIMDAFDTLDLVLAVFGALVVGLWFGAGKNLRGILTGAVMGGLVKPLLFGLLLGGAVVATTQAPALKLTPEQQDKTLKFWTK